MVLNADVFSWGRNVEGQLGDNTTESTFTSAATAYPVDPLGASDDFEILNIARDEIVRGVTTNIPSSAARWALTGEAGDGNANYVVEDNKLKWDGTGNTSVQVTGTLASNYRLQQYRWIGGATNFDIEIDWEILNWDQPSSGTNYMRLILWVSNAAHVIIGRRIDSIGTDETFLQGVPSTGIITWATAPTSGKFKIEYVGNDLTIWMWTGSQWEWDGNTAGYIVSEDLVAPTFVIQHIQQIGSGMNVEWSNLNVIGNVPYGNPAVNPEIPTPGFAYWEQPQSAQGGIGNPFLEFSGDTPGTTANNIIRQYRTYDGSLDTIGPLIEGATLPLWTVTGGNLYWDGITSNPNGARDLHPLLIFEEDFEIIWETNIISAPNTCCWGVDLACYQFGPVRGTSLMAFQAQYGYSLARRYRLYKNPGTGGAYQNGPSRTDAFIRYKIVHTGNNWDAYAWYNGIWNQIGSTMVQTSTHGPTTLTMRFSNWASWPGFQADFQSLTIVPSGTPDGSFYWADAPMVPSPSGYTDETVITVGDPSFEDMTGGVNHAIGLKEDGSVFAWGDNQFGQLGDGTLVNKSSPVSVQGNKSFAEIAPAADHNLALKADGSLFSWGRSNYGQLGVDAVGPEAGVNRSCNEFYGNKILHNVFQSGGRTGWIDIDTDFAWTVGLGSHGTLGDGTTVTKSISSPVTVVDSYSPQYQPRWLKIGLGNNVSYGIRLGNPDIPTQLFAWGEYSGGSLGSLPVADSSTPRTIIQLGLPGVPVGAPPPNGFIDIGGGDFFGCALRNTGDVWCWGSGAQGRLGNNSITAATTPVSVFGTGGSAYQSSPLTVPGTVIRNFSVGENFVVGVDSQGKIWSWGEGSRGQLGNNSTANRSTPTSAIITQGSFFQVAAGNDFTCGLKRGHGFNPAENQYPNIYGGTAWCWGEGQYGRLGDGTDVDKSSPVSVAYNNVYTKIVTGREFACALDHTGHPWCWGYNNTGQLGIGTTGGEQRRPQSCLGGPFSFVDIQCGTDWCVALQEDGQIYYWGWEDWFNNSNSPVLAPLVQGQPSPGPYTYDLACPQKSPITVDGTFITAATGLDHSLAIDRNYQVWAWGRNDAGQLGTGDTINKNTPTLVSGLPDENFVRVTGGAEHSCAMTELGDVWCWGNNEFGQASISPFDIGAIAAGGQGYGGAIDYTTGNLWMWGQGFSGVLGINSVANRSSPVTVAGPQGWGLYEGEITPMIQAAKQIPGGARGMGMFSDNVSWATKTDGSLWMWGNATQGNLGTGQFETDYSSPRSVLGGINFFFVGSTTGSPASTYALDVNGDIWVWGATAYILGGGLGGAAASYNSPVKVADFIFTANPAAQFIGRKFHVLSAGAFGGMALNGPTAWVWGSNSGGFDGRLCTGDLVNYNSPVSIAGAWTHLAHGNGNSMLLDLNGNVWGCGARGGGRSGWGSGGTYESNPTSILGGPHSAIKVAAGNASQVFGFLREDGSLWMWGSNTFGMLGVGDTVSRTSPTSVLGSGDLYNFVDFVVGGQSGTVALDDTGQVWGWGHWSSVGDNTTTQRTSPTKTSLAMITPETFKTPSLVTSSAVDFDAGGYHNIILDTTDRAWAWGRNDLGQLGDNSLTNRYSPVSVYTTHKFVDISAGEQHSWAMKADGTICTWGAGDWGKLLWNSDENPRSIPVCGTIEGIACLPFLPNTGNFSHSTYMECGSQFIAWTWGCNTDGKLGDGSISNKSTPTLVIGNKRWIDMSGGGDFTIAIDTDGRIYSWGDDSKGQLGDG